MSLKDFEAVTYLAPGGQDAPVPSAGTPGASQGETLLWGLAPSAEAATVIRAVEVGGLMPGQVVSGRYRVERWLGAGGSAVVYEALDLQSHQRLALKVLAIPGAHPAHVARFHQEVEHVRSLEHPNIVRIYESGSEGARHFLTTELLEGMDLRQRLLVGPRPTLAESLRWLTHAAAALEYAHACGVLHRDVKPGNLFLTRTRGLKLMDFGLAKSAHVQGVTTQGTVLGTPEYMAPEQVSGAWPVSCATDLYALGVVAYELLTGQLPFRHPQVVPLMMLHLQQPPCAPRALQPHLPESFEQVILKLLAKQPQERYGTAGELRRDLANLWPLVLPPGARTPLPRP